VRDLVAWARERLSPATFGPLALFLALATPGVGPAGVAAIALVVVGLRLEDDLADVAHDRRTHPGRVLPRAWPGGPPPAGVVALLAALTAAGAALAVALAGPRAALLALPRGLVAACAGAPRRARALVNLVKYPALVLTLADPACPRAALAAALAAVLAAFVAHELLHDLALRPAAPALGAALATLAAGPLLAGRSPLLALPAAALCAWVWRRRADAPGAWCRAPFLAALPTVVALHAPARRALEV
jgi:hypothetical protein